MPQGRRKLTIEEALRLPVTGRPATVSIDEALRRPILPQRPMSAPEVPPGFFENLKIGAERGYRKYIDPALASTGEAIEGLIVGDPRRALQLAESAVRGTVEALRPPQQATPVRDPATGTIMDLRTPPPRDTRITELQRQREARYQATPQFQHGQRRLSELDTRAALDPSITGKVTRGTSEFLTGAAPTLGVALATRGALLPTGIAAAVQSAGQPAQAGPNVAAGLLPIPGARMAANAVRRVFGKGAAQVIEAEAAPAATAQVRRSAPETPGAAPEAPPVAGEAIPSPVAPTVPAVDPLQSAFSKLGTDNVDEIAEMIANANRRLNATRTVPGGKKTPITRQERLSSWEDYNKLKQITADEHRALSQVLPARTYSPLVHGYQGGEPSRAISDIPSGEVNAQLEANLRELETFFGAQRGAPSIIGDRIRTMARTPTSPVLVGDVRRQFPGLGKKEFDDEMVRLVEDEQIWLHRHDYPGSLTQAERDAMVKIGDNYFIAATLREPPMSASMRGPSASASLELDDALSGAGARRPPAADIDAPWEPPWASQPLQEALMEGVRGLPTPFAKRLKDEFLGTLGAFKSLTSTGDISYPFRQGAILMLRPLQWRQTQKMWKEMFRGFKTKNFDAINAAIAKHPDAPLAKEVGLAIDVVEEAFPRRAGSRISEAAGKIPGVKHANQAYTTAANVQRFEEFLQYKRLFDKRGLSPEETMKGYKAAAQWINIATGRGGQRMARAFPGALELLNYFFFSPRFIASRLNVFNPVMYARNATSPGGRIVLKRQMADLAQFAGVVATTMYLAKQAGADVSLDFKSPDFLKIRFGRHRYDFGAGLTQVMRAGYRIGADLARAGRGEKPEYGKSAIDIAETFLSYKLSPPAAVFRNFVYQRTPEGRPFTAGRAAADLVVPMQWADFVDAWVQEGLGGAAMTLPGAAGVGAQLYEPNPINDAIEKTRPLFSELQRLDKRVTPLHRRENEPDEIFNSRVQQFGQNYSRFGLQLVASPRFQTASDDLKNRALDQLNGRAKSITLREFAFPELELDAELLMDAAENAAERETETKRQRGW